MSIVSTVNWDLLRLNPTPSISFRSSSLLLLAVSLILFRKAIYQTVVARSERAEIISIVRLWRIALTSVGYARQSQRSDDGEMLIRFKKQVLDFVPCITLSRRGLVWQSRFTKLCIQIKGQKKVEIRRHTNGLRWSAWPICQIGELRRWLSGECDLTVMTFLLTTFYLAEPNQGKHFVLSPCSNDQGRIPVWLCSLLWR